MKLIFYFLVFIILLSSCKQAEVPADSIEFLFNETQPVSVSEISSFPNRFLGNYINKDSNYLIINKKDIFYKSIYKIKISFSSFDSIKESFKIVQNKIYLKKNQFAEYRKLKDSVEITDYSYDTIFTISNNQRAKKIHKTIVLNTKDSIYWTTKFLTLDKNNLKITNLYSNDDLKRIDSLSEVKSCKIDSIKNRIQLSRKEFKKMLGLKHFGFEQNFQKVKD